MPVPLPLKKKLITASLKNEGYSTFMSLIHKVPLNKSNFDDLLSNALRADVWEWVLEAYTPELIDILSTASGWDDWSHEFPYLDQLLLSVSPDPRWLEILSFRWTTVDGRPENDAQAAIMTAKNRNDFFTNCWEATIASSNLTRLNQMLQHPQWIKHLTQEHVCLAIPRSLDVWSVFHNNNQQFPLRRFWQAAMQGQEYDKLHFLMTKVGSSAEFIAQQYAHYWLEPLSDQFVADFNSVALTVQLSAGVLERFHTRLARFFFSDKTSADVYENRDPVDVLRSIPLFDSSHFIDALAGEKSVPWTQWRADGVQALLAQVDVQRLEKLRGHPIFVELPIMQKERIGQNLSSTIPAALIRKM